jgi:uncharacterized protein (TIGR02145 family)
LAVYGGLYNSGLYYQGGVGYYWSSTVDSGTYAYYLYFSASYVVPANYNNKRNGFAVRCVL